MKSCASSDTNVIAAGGGAAGSAPRNGSGVTTISTSPSGRTRSTAPPSPAGPARSRLSATTSTSDRKSAPAAGQRTRRNGRGRASAAARRARASSGSSGNGWSGGAPLTHRAAQAIGDPDARRLGLGDDAAAARAPSAPRLLGVHAQRARPRRRWAEQHVARVVDADALPRSGEPAGCGGEIEAHVAGADRVPRAVGQTLEVDDQLGARDELAPHAVAVARRGERHAHRDAVFATCRGQATDPKPCCSSIHRAKDGISAVEQVLKGSSAGSFTTRSGAL